MQAEAQAEFDRWGANLLIVSAAKDKDTGQLEAIPETAPAMVDRIWPVKATLTTRLVPKASAYRTDKVPVGHSQGITVVVAQGDPFGTLSTSLKVGRWFDNATAGLPTVVLGYLAANHLGADIGHRIWVGQSWFAVIGILEPLPGFLSPLDSTVFVAPEWAECEWPGLPIDQILVNVNPGQVREVQAVLAMTANPANPRGIEVSTASDYGYFQAYVFDMIAIVASGIGSIAMLIGGVGITNTMIVSVMERQGEIGVRRALGARAGQIGLQFVLESSFIGCLGGILGVLVGVYAVFCFAAYYSISFAIPIWVLGAGPLIAILVGAIAGLYPSLKASRQSPMVLLRSF